MYTVGLTGQIACGKSSVARELQSLGAVVINADDLGREVVERDRRVVQKLKRAFGGDIVGSNRKLDRRKLGARAFTSDEATNQLNRIVHPALLARLRKTIAEYRRGKKTKLLVVDAALIYNWGLERELDVVIVIDSTRPNQLTRLERQGIGRREALHRMRRQIPKYQLRRMADAVIHNNGTPEQLVHKVWRLYARLVQHSGQKFD